MLYTHAQVKSIFDQHLAYVQVEKKDHVCFITLNRPQKKNAFNEILSKELAYALSYAHFEKEIWVVVLKAAGDVFCAGADLETFRGKKDLESGSTVPEPGGPVVFGDAFAELHKPCIAQVQGAVYAGGFLMICGCTHVIASNTAKFGLPEVKRGIWPMQVMESLLGIMPARKVLDLCLRGRTLSAQEAFDLGLITQIVDANAMESSVNQLISEIITHSPSAIRLGLKAYHELASIPSEEKHRWLQKQLHSVIETEDAKEGILAFKEKRSAKWKNQ